MVRRIGSVKEENSLTSPTGELLSSVVRRSNGNNAKRRRGTARSEPTNADPTPSSTARNDRRSSKDGFSKADLPSVVPDSPAHTHIEFSSARNSVQWNGEFVLVNKVAA